MWLPLQPPHYFLNIIICCTCNMCPRAVEQETQTTSRENLSSGFPTKLVLNQSLRLNRLARNWNFSRSKCRYDSSKKQTTKLLMRLRGGAGWSAPLLLQMYKSPKTGLCSRGPIAIHARLESMGNYDNSRHNCNLHSLFKAFAVLCRHTKSNPAGDCFLYNTTWYTKVNMVFTELYKPRVTHMKYIEGKLGFF